jgi:hypothetical protein
VSTSAIEDLLRGLEHAGSGHFTVNALPRTRALLELCRTHPSRWVQFVLQGAMAARASNVRVGSERHTVGVEVYLPDELPRELENSDLLIASEEYTHPAAALFSRAIQLAAALDQEYVKVVLETPRGGYYLQITAKEIVRRSTDPLRGTTRLSILVSFSERGTPLRLALSGGLERDLLDRMPLYSIPLNYEGRLLPVGKLTESRVDELRYTVCAPNAVEALALISPENVDAEAVQVPGYSPLRVGAKEAQVTRLRVEGQGTAYPPRFEELRRDFKSVVLCTTPRGDWVLPLDYVPKIASTKLIRGAWAATRIIGEPARLVPVLHGFALDPVELPGVQPGWRMLMAVSELKTDFPGLRAVEDETLAAVVTRAAELLSD